MLELNYSAPKKPVTAALSTMRTITNITRRTREQAGRCGARSCASRRRADRTSAFTLMELVIVILIISILAGAAVPTFFDSLLFHQVESAARRVKSDLELARRTARQTSSTQSITFSGGAYTLSTAIKHLDNPHDEYVVDLSAEPFHLDRITADFEGAPSVSFDGYGAPASGGTVVLECKSLKCTVTLDGVTGEVTITSGHSGGRTAKMAAPPETN